MVLVPSSDSEEEEDDDQITVTNLVSDEKPKQQKELRILLTPLLLSINTSVVASEEKSYASRDKRHEQTF